jgi:3-dehydrosphinganine reductase
MDGGGYIAGIVIGSIGIVILIVSLVQRWLLSYPIRNKLIVITGGSSGIGKSAAKFALAQGARVALIARRSHVLEEARTELLSTLRTTKNYNPRTEEKPKDSMNNNQVNDRITIHTADVCNETSMQQVMQEIVSVHQSSIHGLIASAGMTSCLRFEDTPLSEFMNVLTTNVVGVRNTIIAALPYFATNTKNGLSLASTKPASSPVSAEGGGRIVIISSQAGQLGLYGYSAYSASKFALIGLTQALSMELYNRKILISLCYPPDTDTPMLHSEDETKHTVTRLISETSPCVQPDIVGQAIINGITHYTPHISIGIDGWLLSLLGGAIGSEPILGKAILQAFTLGIGRLIGLVFGLHFYRIVQKHDNNNNNDEDNGTDKVRITTAGSSSTNSKQTALLG